MATATEAEALQRLFDEASPRGWWVFVVDVGSGPDDFIQFFSPRIEVDVEDTVTKPKGIVVLGVDDGSAVRWLECSYPRVMVPSSGSGDILESVSASDPNRVYRFSSRGLPADA